MNNCAMVLDCLSAYFINPVPFLCSATALRALCGVTGSGSRAQLSQHFAIKNNLGEVSAKDSSQETVISLVGMIAASQVIKLANTVLRTWVMLAVLMILHLYTNYRAVRSIVLPELTPQRIDLVFTELIDGLENQLGDITAIENLILRPVQVSQREKVFLAVNALCWKGERIGTLITKVDNNVSKSPYDLVVQAGSSRFSGKPALYATVRFASSKASNDRRISLKARVHALLKCRVSKARGCALSPLFRTSLTL